MTHNISNSGMKIKLSIVCSVLASYLSGGAVFADTVYGGGYTVNQILAPVSELVNGNGYSLVGSGDYVSGGFSTGTFNTLSPFGGSGVVASSSAPVVSGGGGYYVMSPKISTSTKEKYTDSILTENGSTCASRITFSSPIDISSPNNNKEDVKKLEKFLNTYENEKLPVNGVYETKDIEAVKRWQVKYKSFILEPMRLKSPTGTVYTLSQRQIERQTASECGTPVVVNTCPFFNATLSFGDRGEEVKKIQQFLVFTQGEKLPISGVYGPLTKRAVLRFQKMHRSYILSIVRLSFITGNWNTLTRMKANEVIGCDKLK